MTVPDLINSAKIKLNSSLLLPTAELLLGCGMSKRRRDLPTLEDLRAEDDDLRAQYEEILRLQAELDRLLTRSKPSPARKKQVARRKSKARQLH